VPTVVFWRLGERQARAAVPTARAWRINATARGVRSKSLRFVRNLCRAGKLRHFRVGCTERGPIRIRAEAMREFERCASAPPPAAEPVADRWPRNTQGAQQRSRR
jgi:hypothetical protein